MRARFVDENKDKGEYAEEEKEDTFSPSRIGLVAKPLISSILLIARDRIGLPSGDNQLLLSAFHLLCRFHHIPLYTIQHCPLLNNHLTQIPKELGEFRNGGCDLGDLMRSLLDVNVYCGLSLVRLRELVLRLQ